MRLHLTGATLAILALPAAASAQNLIANPSFENNLNSWGRFGNVFAETPQTQPGIVPRTGNVVAKIFGPFQGAGTLGVSGLFQTFPAAPGDTFTMDCWTRHDTGDQLVGSGPPNDNWCIMRIAFFDATGTEIGGVDRTVLDGTSPTDVWIDNQPITGTAPAGTTLVQPTLLFLQPNNAGGASLWEDVEFFRSGGQATYPGTGEDFVLQTGLNGGSLSNIDQKSVMAGDLLEVNVSSPNGTYDRFSYFLVGQIFVTGVPPTPTIRNFWFDLSGNIGTLVGNGNGPLGPSVIAPGTGSSSYYNIPPLSTLSVMLQGIVLDASAANGRWALTDAHEIQIQ